jgi:RHS repeat-associated protein
MKTLLRSSVVSLLISLIAAAPLFTAPNRWPATLAMTAETRGEPIEKVRTVEARPSGANAFQLVLDAPPETISRAFLLYELTGVPHWTAAVRSINGLPARGGFGAVASPAAEQQIEEINPRWLRAGPNQILFAPAPAAERTPTRLVNLERPDVFAADRLHGTVPYTVSNLRLVYLDGTAEPTPLLRLTHPSDDQETDADGTLLRGYVDPPGLPTGPAELFVDEVYVPQGIQQADGSFSVFVPRNGAETRIEVVYPDGSRLRRQVRHADESDGDDSEDTDELDADANTGESLDVGDARLDVRPGALSGKVKLTMRRLRRADLPALDAGMTNVTPRGGGFRMGPHGLRFKKAVQLSLPYDAALIPAGMSVDDVRTYYFDEAAGRWMPVPRVEAKADAEVIVSATDHFTDFVNATLALPDDSSGANYSPNSLQELAKADPASEVVQIAPPEGGPSGSATLDFPLVVPPGRQGMEPELAVRYDSSGANGWLGVGWDLQLPSIEISTLFGVPRYDGTERYTIAGEQLAATSSPGVFVRRTEGSFDRIVRKGNDPASYWWEVTDKNGTRFVYGQSAQARLSDPRTGNVFRWHLEQEIDLHGNSVDYFYVTDRNAPGAAGEPWVEVYPERIEYTGGPNVQAFYKVTFALDAPDTRPDRLSSGRQGFKTYTRRRLASVDVLAGANIVRRYVFAYRAGDFQKSLLASIAVTGEGGAAEFYRHSFDYVPMAEEADGYDGFTAQQAWGQLPGKDFTEATRIGGGAHAFAGLGPVGCQPHVGLQLGGSGTDTTQSVSFLDVNGDGLPDRLDDDGNVQLNQYDPAGSGSGSFRPADFGDGDTLGHTSEWTLDLLAGLHAEAGITGRLDKSWVWSYANDDHLVADLNGDLRPDLVSTDGGFSVRVNNGRSFSAPTDWLGFSGQGLNRTTPGEGEVLANFPLSNPLRQLVLPYTGRVTLSGAVAKKVGMGDGVDVFIYHNETLIWFHRFAAGDTAPCVPGPANSCNGGLGRDVKAGDSLYFLAGSVRDTAADDLLWAPAVSYDGKDAQAREPYGARTFVFDAGEDFTLAGYRGASWLAGAAGTVRISGSLVKQGTSDDVVVSVAKNDLAQVVFTRTFAAAEQASFDGFPPLTVAEGDRLFLRISSRTPIDPKRIQWTPTVAFEGATVPALTDSARTQRAQVGMAVPEMLPADKPTRSWSASSTGEQKFKIECSSSASGMFYLQGVNRLLAARALPEKSFELPVAVTAGEPLFFSVVSNAPAASDVCKVSGDIPLNVRWPATEGQRVLSGGHHGWFYGDWNGNFTFNAAALVPPKTKDDKTPDFMPAVPRWEGTRTFPEPVWIAGGFDLYLAAQGVKPSRKGANAGGILDQASGTSAAGGLSVLRKTASKTDGLAAGAGIAGLTLSSGTSDTDLDLLDMNGDRYPDQVSSGGVRFSNGTSGFAPLESFPGLGSSLRRSEDRNVSLSVGIGINFTKKNGNGKPTAIVNTLPSVGSTVSLTQTKYDLIDVNGDSLPDRVAMQPGSGVVTVQLNLGYRFGAAETWSLPPLSGGSRCKEPVDSASSSLVELSALDTLNGLSFTRSSALQGGVAIGPFGGGASTTLVRTLVELVDVNGDALPDRVAKEEGDPYFRVQLNLGDRWDGEQRWYVPGWSAGIGGAYNAGGAFQCLDAVTFSGHTEVNVSAGAPVCIPLVPPVPVAGLQIEISAQAFDSISSGLQLFLDDIDGDGLADHILKKAGNATVYVKRNQAGKVNLLSTIHRPLGSTVNLAYQRRGNHPDMPFSQWVLSEVKVTDGRGTAPYVTRYDYANDAFYDRAERENYGFGHVRVTLPDGSTIDRDFLNRTLYSRHLQTKEVLADSTGKLFHATTNTYEERPVAGSGASRFPALVAETTSLYEGTTTVEANPPKTTSRSYDYDSMANVIRTIDTADAGADDDVIATIAYDFDPASRLTRPGSIEVRDGAGRLLRRRQGTHNGKGDLTRLEQTLIGGREPDSGFTYSGSKNAIWTYTPDEFGNIATSVDPTGFTSTLTYDPTTKTHPVEVSDSFGYRTRYGYDLDYGHLVETIDQNDNVLRRAHDAFGRLIRVAGPYDSDAAPTLAFEYGLGAPVSWAVAHHKDATRSDTIDSAVFIDSLERVLQTKDEAELDQGSGTSTRSGMRVSGRIAFDSKGRVASEGQPVFDDRPANQFVEVAAKNPATFTYDALDRTRTVRFAHGGVTRIDYVFGTLDGARRLLTVRTDPQGRATRFYRDVQDNVLGVEQTNTIGGAKKTLVTRYAYDALDQLLTVTDAKGNATRLEYDTLGRNVILDNPDLGRTESRYDPAGNLRAKITANLAAANQQIRYLYTYHRLDRVDYPTSPDVAYTYGGPGAPSNRANRIVTVADGSGVEERSYGKLGEIVQTVKTTAALNGSTPKGPFTTRFQFDSFNRLLSVVYPDGETLTYGYDAGGQVKSASGLLKGVRFDYLRHLGYDEFGEHARMVLGNGVETRYTHDPVSRFLTGLRTTAAGRDLQNLRYQYDLTETVQTIQNDVPVPAPSLYGGPTSQSFRYDDLVQLVGAQGTYRTGPNKTSTYALTLGYDELGNTVAKTQLHQSGNGDKLNVEKKSSYDFAYAYAAPQPHAPTRIGDRGFRYDRNGNQLGWDSDANGTRRTLAWDEENRLASVADNGQTTRFLYDAEGTRTNKAGQHGETTYVNRWFSLRNGAIASKHVFADQLRLATKVSPDPNPTSEKVYFYQADHLGSAQFITDELGAVFQHLEYFPSGEIWVDERSETQRTPYLFSGKELDEETGLSYFGYRYYDARQGQWISADPILDELPAVGKLRRDSTTADAFFAPGHIYGYAGNNPANLIDPDGLTKGGVYIMKDANGIVRRTGRATDLHKRELQHARDPVLGALVFKVKYKTDNKKVQRGLEHLLYNKHRFTASPHHGGFNLIRGISVTNPKRPMYIRAARGFLANLGRTGV